MGQSREIIERQLQKAKFALDQYSERLAAKKLDTKQQRRDAIWRKLDARLRKLNSRLQSVSRAEALLLTMETARIERQNQPKVEAPKKVKAAPIKPEKKPAKERQPKPEAAAKA